MSFKKKCKTAAAVVAIVISMMVAAHAVPGQKQFDATVGIYNEMGLQGSSMGSGFLISQRGYIMTAAHVLQEGVTPEVLYMGKVYKALVVVVDEYLDVAVIHIPVRGPVMHGRGRKVREGEAIYALGYAMESMLHLDRPTLSTGKFFRYDYRSNAMYANMPVVGGMSGGPVLDENNRVVAITTAIKIDLPSHALVTHLIDFEIALFSLERISGLKLADEV